MIDASTPGSPGWWFDRLLKRLGDRQSELDFLNGYYEGTNAVPINAAKGTRDAYRRLMHLARTNFAELVVEAVRERMAPVGFRTGVSKSTDDAAQTDSEAWRIWQANSLDADASLVHRSMLSMRSGYVIVGAVDPDIGAPLITPEDPREVIVECDPVRRRKVVAGLKVFRDDVYGADRAYLYLPGVVVRVVRPSVAGGFAWDVGGWKWDGKDKLPAPVVPVVPFLNRADMSRIPKAEFEPHIPILDRINYTVLSRLEIATLQAFRQRAIKGDLPTNDPETGELVDYNNLFAADPGALWILPAGADLWESGGVDLNPIRQAIRDDVQDLAAVSRTPLFYLTPDSASGSAEGASLAREGLVFKTADRLNQTGEEWEQVMSLAFLMAGDEQRGKRTDMEVIWTPPERFSLAERYDAASKAAAAGVPWRTVMTDVLQFSPTQVDRMESERTTDALMAPEPAPVAGF